MNEDELEAAVLEFLERRDAEPSLTPEAFATSRAGAGPELLEAIREALEVERLFPEAGSSLCAIGPYRVVGELGRGGMGIVYRAEREGRAFAVKLLPLAPVLGPRVLERFRREARMLAQLSHPRLVRIHDSGMHGEMPYLVMDLVEGRPLNEVAPTLSREAAARLIEELAEALHAAHRQGILHRDLKPQNVMVRPDGTPVLLDFGLSVAEGFATLTSVGEMVGTPRYMAPEQVRGERVDARTDLHALGLIYYELVMRRPAREETSRDALLEAVRRGRLRRPRSLDRTLPRDLERILLTALAADPERRYPDVLAFAEDVGRLRRGEPVLARPPGLVARTVEALRHDPLRRGSLIGAIGETLGVVAARLRPAGEPGLEARQQASRRANRAATLWLDGDFAAARAELAQARRLDPREPTASLLAAHLAGSADSSDASPSLRAAREGLRLYEAAAWADSAASLRGGAAGEFRPALVTAVAGLAAFRAGDTATAFEELTAAARLFPDSVEVHRGLARVSRRLDRLDEAARALRRVGELAEDSAETWTDLADVHLEQRNLAEGLQAIERAETLAGTESVRLLLTRAGLEIHSGRQAEGQRRLERALTLDPGNVDARYLLAYSLDLEHRMVEAEQEYRRVVDARPDHVRALLCLANLSSGASRGQCRGCDEFYAAHPESIDFDRAERDLLLCLEADRGESDWVLRSARDITLRLPRRGAVIDLLVRLAAVAERTPAALRLEEVVRRLRLLSG